MSIRTVQMAGLASRHTTVSAKPTTNITPWVRNPSWLSLPFVADTEEKFVGLHAVWPESNFLALQAGQPTATNVISAGNTTDASAFVVASTTLTAGLLYVLTVENSHNTDATTISAITGGTGAPTFTQRATIQFNNNLNRITVFTCVPSTNYTGTLTINFGGVTQTGAIWNLTTISGADTTLDDGFVQIATETGSSTTPSATLAAFGQTYNSTFCAVASAGTSSSFTPGAGFATLGNTAIVTPDQRLSVQWSGENNTLPSATITNASWAMVAIEFAMRYVIIDWGDGVIENWGAGARAQHIYDFANASLANTDAPVTFLASNSTVNRIAHGYTNGMKVSFATITTTTGIVAGQIYFVVNATADTFQVSATQGGTALTLTGDGSGTLLPYKQAIVTVIPQEGQSLASLRLNVKHNQLDLKTYVSGWLDLIFSGPNLTDLFVGASSAVIRHNCLEQAALISDNNIDKFSSTFQNCTNLANIPTWQVRAGGPTSTSYMFFNCYSLQTVPLFNTANVTDMSYMFNSCRSLQSVPMFNTANVTNMNSMFQYCYNLQTVPLSDTARVTDMGYMFQSCYNLQSVPLFNTANVTNMNSMFVSCRSLQSVPLFNTANVTDMRYMFQYCYNLGTVPLFDTTKVTDMSYMFQFCSSLQSVPMFNTVNVTNMSYMFSGCLILQSVPMFNTAKVTTMSYMFNNCYSLQTVPLFNTANVTNMSYMFQFCYSLGTVPLFDTTKVTDMYRMFDACQVLQSVPLFNTANVTNMGYMFSSCRSLQSVPLFNTAKVTNMSYMFYDCSSLQSVPALNTSAVSSSGGFSNMFDTCTNLARIQAKNFRFTFSVANCKLSAGALNEIYTNLPTVTGQTITVTGNYGTANDDPTIATAKGWTVTG